jgi:hypothetical protein
MKLPTSPAARAAGIGKNHENAVTVSAELDAPETLTGLGRVSIGASFNLGVFTTIRFAADRVIRRSSFGDYPVALSLIALPFVLGLGASNSVAKWLAVAAGITAWF